MANAALMPPVVAETSAALIQAREWVTRKITSGDRLRMIDMVERAAARFGAGDDDDDDDDAFLGDWLYGPNTRIEWDRAVDLLREASNHYPHPSAGAIFDAAFARLPHGITASEPHVEEDELADLITDILENPDALLG